VAQVVEWVCNQHETWVWIQIWISFFDIIKAIRRILSSDLQTKINAQYFIYFPKFKIYKVITQNLYWCSLILELNFLFVILGIKPRTLPYAKQELCRWGLSALELKLLITVLNHLSLQGQVMITAFKGPYRNATQIIKKAPAQPCLLQDYLQ
jgi:hypothetical protein